MTWSSVLLVLIATAAGAQSVNKCVDAEGNITFLQGDCPKTDDQEEVTIHQENREPNRELRFPEASEPGLEWVWVASVLDDNDGGVIVREGGDAHLIQTGLGCDSLWLYQEAFAQVFAPGEFGDPDSVLLLPDHQQRCLLQSVRPIAGGVDLGATPAPPAPAEPPPVPPPVPVPQRRETQAAPEPSESLCRGLRHRYKELNVRCRGLEECNRKRSAIDGLKYRWVESGCEGALGIGPY